MLILLPNLLGKEGEELIPPIVSKKVALLDGLIAESEKAARAFLHRYKKKVPIALLREDVDFLLEPLEGGEVWGVIADAGLPCLADPGAKLVARAYEKDISVEAIPGPSSIMLALMLAGLPAQQFAFQGYLERNRKPHIRRLEFISRKEHSVQMVIETPYKSQHTLEALVESLASRTRLSVAWDLTQEDQGVITLPVADWRQRKLPDIRKKPAIFLLLA